MNPYVFIVGCPRSGTTLLRRIVDAHPEIAITRETHWIPELIRDGRCVDPHGRTTRELPAVLESHPKFATLGIDHDLLERLAADARLSYPALVRALFDHYGAARGKRLVGDKTPGYVSEIALLHGLFPRARFVHLVRDGRDVCLSALGWERKAEQFRRRFPTWEDAPAATAALWWRWHVLHGRGAGRELGPDLYHELRYEALVAQPERECRRLCDFLGLAFDTAMLRFHEGRTRHEPGLSAKRAWLPPTPGLRDWRTQMPDDQVEAFEAAAGDALDVLGYARAVPTPAATRQPAAAALASAFPGRPLPEGW
ncbi:MAG: sulfotransferase family protein [Solirubrobacteraceae bacterium]